MYIFVNIFNGNIIDKKNVLYKINKMNINKKG